MFERRRAELCARPQNGDGATGGSDGVLDRYRRMLRERDDEPSPTTSPGSTG